MTLHSRFRSWLSMPEIWVALIALIVISWKLTRLSSKSQLDTEIYTIGSSTQNFDVTFLRQDISPYITADNGRLYAVSSLTWDTLMAIDIKTGSTVWEIQLPFERSGVRGILANDDMVFTVNATRLSAYEAQSGELSWIVDLGRGHVSIIPQIDAGILRIYYGNKLFEVDPETGKILKSVSRDLKTWIYGNVLLEVLPDNNVSAYDKQTGRLLWSTKCGKCGMPEIDEGREPQVFGSDKLIVSNNDRQICALSLQTGEEIWCQNQAYSSKVAIDFQSGLGYALRGDRVLVTIDLQNGDILGETSFIPDREAVDEKKFFSSSIAFSDGVVVITLNDSGQSFGLSIR